MLLGGGGCCMSNFSFVILHCSFPRKILYPHSPFWEGIDSSINICIYINISFKNIFYLSSFMPVPFHTLRKAYLTIRPLLKRLNPLCLFKRFLYHPSLLYHSILWRGQLGRFPCNMLSALIHSSLRGLIDCIYLWESLFYHPSLLAHSVLLKGLISLLPFTTLFYHPLLGWLCLLPCNILLYPSSFLSQGIVFSKLPLSSCIALSFHATMDMIFYPHSLLWEGVHFPISFQKSFVDSSILRFSPTANFSKMPFDHSFPFWRNWFFGIFQ